MEEVHAFPKQRCSLGFTKLWGRVVKLCYTPFQVLTRQPSEELDVAYNGLIKDLCSAHEKVYALTTCEYFDVPLLEHGAKGSVTGKDAIASQSLAVLYLTRDYICVRVRDLKRDIDGSIDSYVRTYERFTCAINCIKSCFTFHHWVWLKYGVPNPHTIASTELMASVLWTDIVMEPVLLETLKNSVTEVVNMVRSGKSVEVQKMEIIKRLSLNLYMLPDTKFYMRIIEQPYIEQMIDYYTEAIASRDKTFYQNAEVYILWCDKQLKREYAIACSFLNKSSYRLIKQKLTDALYSSKVELLSSETCELLINGQRSLSKFLLKRLYRCIVNGDKRLKIWLGDVIQRSIGESFAAKIKVEREKMEISEGTCKLNSKKMFEVTFHAARSVLHHYRGLITDTFSSDPGFLTLVRDEVYANIINVKERDLSQEPIKSTIFFQVLVEFCVAESEAVFSPNLDLLLNAEKMCVSIPTEKFRKRDQMYFFTFYLESLINRVIKTICNGGDLDISEKREKAMVHAFFSQRVPFDCIYRCNLLLKDFYGRSTCFWNLYPNVRPLVFKNCAWKLSTGEDKEIRFPSYLAETSKRFVKLYEKKFIGLRISLVKNHSIVKVCLTQNSQVQFIMTLYQACIALLFNEKQRWYIENIIETSRISREDCLSSISDLAACGILQANSDNSEIVLGQLHTLKPGTLSLVRLPSFGLLGDEDKAGLNSLGKSENLTTKERAKRSAVEAQVAKVLKEKNHLTLSEIESSVSLALKGMAIASRDIKEAVEKLVERGLAKRDETSKVMWYVT